VGGHDRRLEKLAMPAEVLTALSERDATRPSPEHGAGAALQAMITNS
jgi:hypothetical protein